MVEKDVVGFDDSPQSCLVLLGEPGNRPKTFALPNAHKRAGESDPRYVWVRTSEGTAMNNDS